MILRIFNRRLHAYYTQRQFFTKFSGWLCSVFRVNGGWLQYHFFGVTVELYSMNDMRRHRERTQDEMKHTVAANISVQDGQVVTVTIQPVDAAGIPVGNAHTQTFDLDIVPGPPSSFTFASDIKAESKLEVMQDKQRMLQLED